MPYTIRELRERAGLTQEKLAEAIEVAPRTIKRWEAREVQPRLLYCLRLAQMFQIPLDEIADAPAASGRSPQHD